MEHSGFMHSDELIEDVIIEKLSHDRPSEKVQKIYNICKDVKGQNSCETAFKIYECYVKNRNN